jgi:glyoxylase-like metal-dependent hydrolase (beta-lactamase superfamily II)/GNAT superfamily N-acetyltransferase
MTKIVPLRPGLWLTELSLDEFDVRGSLIVGEQRVLIWDTLSHPRDMTVVCEFLAREGLADRQLLVVYSHADWDHVWGTGGLPAGIPVIAQAACAKRFAGDVPDYLAEARCSAPGRWDDVELIPPTITFDQKLTVELGGVKVELSHLPGHTEDCLVAFVPEWGVFLGGDTIETPFPLLDGPLSVQLWIDRLSEWAGRTDVETVIPCHGEIGGRGLIERNIAYLSGLLDGCTQATPGGDDSFYEASHIENMAKAKAQVIHYRPIVGSDRSVVEEILVRHWGSEIQVVNGKLHRVCELPGILAEQGDTVVGLITFRFVDDACEIMTLNSMAPGRGIGRRLIDRVVDGARQADCRRVTVVTTNDNWLAQRLYQRAGFTLAEARINAVARSRQLKSSIPLTGIDDISIRDELAFELLLSGSRSISGPSVQ